MGGLFSSPSKEDDLDNESTPTPTPTQYTYMFPGSFVKFKNDIDGIYKIDIRKNDGKVINPNIFKTSDGDFSPELLKAVDYKIEQQNEYTYRRRDNDGSSDWDNWVPGKAPPGVAAGGKRRKKSRKTRKARKSRKSRKSRKI
jgi:hypothetical protein